MTLISTFQYLLWSQSFQVKVIFWEYNWFLKLFKAIKLSFFFNAVIFWIHNSKEVRGYLVNWDPAVWVRGDPADWTLTFIRIGHRDLMPAKPKLLFGSTQSALEQLRVLEDVLQKTSYTDWVPNFNPQFWWANGNALVQPWCQVEDAVVKNSNCCHQEHQTMPLRWQRGRPPDPQLLGHLSCESWSSSAHAAGSSQPSGTEQPQTVPTTRPSCHLH